MAHQYREHNSIDSTCAPETPSCPAALCDDTTYYSSVGKASEEMRNQFDQLLNSCLATASTEASNGSVDADCVFFGDAATAVTNPHHNPNAILDVEAAIPIDVEHHTQVDLHVADHKKADPLRDHQSVTFQEMCQFYPWMSQTEHQNYWMNIMVVPMSMPSQELWSMPPFPASQMIDLAVEDAGQDLDMDQAKRRRRSRSRPGNSGNSSQNNKNQRAPMPGSDEDWNQRIKKRLEGLDAMRKSDAYISNRGLERRVRPQTPDPYDHCLSKRDWEKALGGVRAFHRNVHALHHEKGYDKTRAALAWKRAAAICKKSTNCSRNEDPSLDQVWNKALEILG